MTNGEVEIVEILPDSTGAGIARTAMGYCYRLEYRLADGTILPSTQSRRLLRDAKAQVASLPKAPEHPTKARFMDGRFVATSTEYYIGPRGA